MSSKEISLSVEETNELRAKLGLKPLVVNKEPANDSGEISLSVEETNKLRASLGLKPLKVGKDEGKKVLDKPPVVVDARETETQARIKRSRERRQLKEKLGTTTLGDGEHESTLSWLKQSAKRQEAAQREAEIQEQEAQEESAVYDASQLSGIKLSHNVGDHLKEGEEVVLTLKDTAILDKNGQLVEDRTDELENVYIAEGERYKKRKRAEKLISKATASYTGLDEEEDKTVLAKYDTEAKLNDSTPVGVLDGSGILPGSKKGGSSSTGREGRMSLLDMANQNLSILGVGEQDFLTSEETKKVARKRDKKKRKKRRRDKSRNLREVDNELTQTEDNADSQLQKLNSSKRKKQGVQRIETEEQEDEADDLGLEAALSKVRQALNKKKTVQMELGNEDNVSTNVYKTEYLDEGSASRVLTGATEFSARIEHSVANLREEAKDSSLAKDEAGPTDSKDLSETIPEPAVVKQEDQVNKIGVADMVTVGGTKLAKGGMAAALSAFKNSGNVVKVVPKEEATKKKRPRNGAKRDFQDIDLTYRDKEGNVLTTKEAYLELCYKFHGIKPGKKSIAKKKRREEQERRTHTMGTGDTPLGTASALRKLQAKTGAAYVKLGNKADE